MHAHTDTHTQTLYNTEGPNNSIKSDTTVLPRKKAILFLMPF